MKIDLLGGDERNTPLPYSLEQFEKDVQNFKPRVFDTYILPGFLMVYAVKSKEMRKSARRILFTSSIYMMYRNYAEYKRALTGMQNALRAAKGGADEQRQPRE